MKSVKSYFVRNYFESVYPIEYRIYMIFFIESLLISILSAATNTLLGKGLLGVILQWSYNVICLAFLLIKPRIRMKLLKPQLLFMAFIYIPFLFFQTAGYEGTALLFAQLAIFLLVIVFTGKQRIIILILNTIEYLGCILLQYNYPQLVVPHGTVKARVIDLVVAVILSFTGLAIITAFIRSLFNKTNIELTELSNKDALTGAFNRRYLEEFLRYRLTEEHRASDTYVIMLDLDFFKSINDTYGHSVGDKVLQDFVNCIQDGLRGRDVLARYGGEEFMVIIQNVAEEQMLMITERLRKAVEDYSFPKDIKITTSMGLTKAIEGDAIDTVFKRVDKLLYTAKENGRNQIVTNLNIKEGGKKNDIK